MSQEGKTRRSDVDGMKLTASMLISGECAGLSAVLPTCVFAHGYFASSWTAQGGKAVQRESRETSDRNRRTKQPWATVYHTKTQGKDGVMTPWGVKKNMGQIKRRFGLNGYDINFKKYKTVYIGNKAAYAAYALEDGLSLAYITDLGKVVNQAFREDQRLASIRAAVVPKARVDGKIPETKTGIPGMGTSVFVMEGS